MQNAQCRMQNEAPSRENVSVDKSFEFAVRIVNLYKFLTREHKEYALSPLCLCNIGTNTGTGSQQLLGKNIFLVFPR